MSTYCNFCFSLMGIRKSNYECIRAGKKINLSINTCMDCEFYYDFHPRDIEGETNEDLLEELGLIINENKIKETFCYLCSNHNGEYITFKWKEEEIHLRMCQDCILKLPVSEDKFTAKGDNFEEALIFIKRSLLF